MKVLGIDYGIKNLGFAIAETPYATPLSSQKVDSLRVAVNKTLQIINNVHADYVVVGIPENGPIVRSVHEFIKALSSDTNIPVTTHSETLTTKDAIAKLRSIKASKNKLMSDHSYAACLILEDYLDLHPDLVQL